MKVKILMILLPLTLLSCKKDKETVTADSQITSETSVQDSVEISNTSSETVDTGTFRLDKFGFPEEVEGCSCYFAENKADFEDEKFVYIDDYGNTGYIKIQNKLIKIPMEEGDFDPENFQKTIENADYKVEMKGKKLKEMYEVMMFDGEMTVTDKKTGETATTVIHGECGC